MKTKFVLLLTVLLLRATTSFALEADGTCGKNLTWALSEGTLTISGAGEMEDYTGTSAPWRSIFSSIETVVIGDDVTSIGNYAFYKCSNLTSVIIGNRVESIEGSAFYNCERLASVTIPNSVTSIGNSAFYECCDLASITIGNSVENIGRYAFAYCSSLGLLTIPNSVTSIGNNAFSNCTGLTSATIGNGVESVGEKAFSDCRKLVSVTIGSRVESIASNAFAFCFNLASVTNLNPMPQAINSDVFLGVIIGNVALYVPSEESVEIYREAPVWQNFRTTMPYVPSAVNAPAAANAIRIYPNPATESFRIDGLTASVQVAVTDVNGRPVFRKTVAENEPIAIGHLPQGIYVVNVNGKTMKIIKN
jgi:hypothetical protein